MESGQGGGAGIVLLLILVVGYFLPTLIAQHRKRDGLGMIFLLNLLLGWTVIGWIVMLVVAFTGESGAAKAAREEQTGLLRQIATNRQNGEAP